MAGTIYQETFTTGTDKCLVLSNEEAGRAMEIGSDWTRIRIAFQVAIEPVSTSNITTAQLRFGISSARDDHYGSQSASHWYGYISNRLSMGYVSAGTMTYVAGGGNPYFNWAEACLGGVVNSSFHATTQAINGAAISVPTSTGSTKRRGVLFLELKKVTTTLLMYVGFPEFSGAGNRDYLLSEIVTSLEDATDYTSAGHISCGGITFNDSKVTMPGYTANAALYGEVDSIHIGFNKVFNPLRIYSVVVARYE